MIAYMRLRHQHHKKLLLIMIINMQSTFLPASLADVHLFKKFFHWWTRQ